MNQSLVPPEPFPRRSARLQVPQDPDGIELRLLVRALFRRKWLIALCVLLAAGAALAGLRTVSPSYVSSTEVLLNTRQERVIGVEQVVSDLDVTNSVIAGEIERLRSNLLLGRVVDKLDLIHHPEFDPYVETEPSRVARWLEVARTRALRLVRGDPPPGAEEASGEGAAVTEDQARTLVISRVRQSLTASQRGISYVIQIAVQAQDPAIAAAIANAVSEQYLQDQLDVKLAATQRAIQWLDTRLVELESQLRSAEDAVVDFLADQALNGGGDESSIEQQLAELNRTIVGARSDRAAAEERLTYVRQQMAEGGVDAAAQALATPRLASLDVERANLERSIAQDAGRLGPRHPEMVALNASLADLTRDRAAAVDAAIGELTATLAQASGRESAMEATINSAHVRQVELSRDSVRLRQLERSADAMRQVYENFLARFQETTQQLEFQRPDAQIISRAEPAVAPSRPRRQLVLAVALLLGAILGVAIAIATELMNRTVRSSAELGRASGLPVLSVLPRVRHLDRGVRWQIAQLQHRQASPYAEGLRLLRAALLNSRLSAPPRIIMFTAAESYVGCSTTVLGFARTVVALGQRVVILEANFRRPALHRMLRLEPGAATVGDYIAGTAPLAEMTVAEPEPGLSVIPIARPQANAADLLSSARFQRLIAELAERYDTVLIDAAPCVGLADARILAGQADAIVLIARNGRSREEALVSAINALEQVGGTVVGAVFSRADRSDRWTESHRRPERAFEFSR